MGLKHSRSKVIKENCVKSLSDDNLTWYQRPVKLFSVTKKHISTDALPTATVNKPAWTSRDVIDRLKWSTDSSHNSQPLTPEVTSVTCEPIAEDDDKVCQPVATEVTSATNDDDDDDDDSDDVRRVVESAVRRAIDFLVYEIEPVVLAEHVTRRKRREALINCQQTNWFNSLPNMMTSPLSADEHQLRKLLTNIIGDMKSEEYLTFCNLLRKLDVERQTARLLEGLDLSVKVISKCLCVCCVEMQSARRHLSDRKSTSCRRSNLIDVVYTDSQTKGTASFSDVQSLKRSRRRKSSLIEESTRPTIVLRDTADRFTPMLSIRLEGCSLCELRTRRLERLLETVSCVHELAIVDCQLDPPVVLRLSRVLQLCTELYSLNLRHSQLANDGVTFLAYALRHNKSLRALSVAQNQLTETGCCLLVRSISQSRGLCELDVSENSLGNKGCQALAGLLAHKNGSLKKLVVSNCDIEPRGAVSLFNALRHNSKLCLLDISGNNVGDEGVQRLAEILIFNRTLRELSLSGCNVSDTACQTMSRSLTVNTTMRMLHLDSNSGVTDDGILHLADSLKYNRFLEHLYVNNCSITAVGLSYLITVLYDNCTLKLLDVRLNNIIVKQSGPAIQGDTENIIAAGNVADQLNTLLCANKSLRVLVD